MWLQSSNSAKDLGVGENVTPTSKQPSDAGENVTPASKQPSVANGQSIANNCLGGSEEGSGAGSGEPEEQERRGDE